MSLGDTREQGPEAANPNPGAPDGFTPSLEQINGISGLNAVVVPHIAVLHSFSLRAL